MLKIGSLKIKIKTISQAYGGAHLWPQLPGERITLAQEIEAAVCYD